MSNFASPSPPPLRHPVPTHPAYIPEPPATPVSPQGYQRYSSSPGPPGQQQPQQYSTHVPAYTSPFQHAQPPPQMQQQMHPQQQQQQQGASFVPPPNFAAWGMNDATAQFGLQLGSSAVAAGQDYVQRNFGGIFPSAMVKHHFNVSNSYVMKKLQLVVFPWRHKPWSRRIRRSEQGQNEWQPPRDDINSPDLYIPLMAYVTYVLICAFHSGLNERFHPKVLGETATTALVVVLADFAFFYIGCYFLNCTNSGTIVDLLAYCGYKFVGVILVLLVGFLRTGSTLWYLLFLYFFAANAFFLLRSLRSVVLPDANVSMSTSANPTSTATITSSARRRRIIFLFLEAVFCQIVYMFVLVKV